MLNFLNALQAFYRTGCPLAKWLNHVLHPPTVVVEEVPLVVPTRTLTFPPTRTVSVPIVTGGGDILWPLVFGLIVTVLLSSLVLLSQKVWGRRALVLFLAAPVIIVSYLTPTLLESSAFADVVAHGSDIVHWSGLIFTDVAEWASPCSTGLPASCFGKLFQNSASLGKLVVFWMDTVERGFDMAGKVLYTISFPAVVAFLRSIGVNTADMVARIIHSVPRPTLKDFLSAMNVHKGELANYWTNLVDLIAKNLHTVQTVDGFFAIVNARMGELAFPSFTRLDAIDNAPEVFNATIVPATVGFFGGVETCIGEMQVFAVGDGNMAAKILNNISLPSVVESFAAVDTDMGEVTGPYTMVSVARTVDIAAKASHHVQVPTVVGVFAAFVPFLCLEPVAEELMCVIFMSKPTLSDPPAQNPEPASDAVEGKPVEEKETVSISTCDTAPPDLLTQRRRSVRGILGDVGRTPGFSLLLHLHFLRTFATNVTFNLAFYVFVFIFLKPEDRMRYISELPVVGTVYRCYRFMVTNVSLAYGKVSSMLRFTQELAITLPNWGQLKAGELHHFRLDRIAWDHSACLERDEFGELSQGGQFERTLKLGHSRFMLTVFVAPSQGRYTTILPPP